ncbi:hypothetical protein H8Z72_23360 (plasmid) [Xanthomonas citri pv. citri]|uniref:hypothetical protein n=1 Tax=Xanthomonas citri TaxID=346 RepID=UPI0019321787|nr:hypothetical protein [Xanthomonas citri]QRD62747.1 hypothetical protein H8Z74_22825 [Xanthomonas citri pv. citri]QRD67074.1 hypothetical protein H8Z73_22910 [Xanthomonas citri pv. citri]QRD71673.1 hypothetical protein H8Z72_23360 [Xanthomonas citri pv. citri]
MTNADEIVLMGRLLDRDPMDNPDELSQVLASCSDVNKIRAYTRQSGLIRQAAMTPVCVRAGK